MKTTNSISVVPQLPASAVLRRNLSVPELVNRAVRRGEGQLSSTGALAVLTGKYTGRSPKDKYIVCEPSVMDHIAWGPVNKGINPETFERLYEKTLAYLEDKELFVFDGYAGADARFRMPIRIVNEYAWHNLFVQQLFVRGTQEELSQHEPEFTVIAVPGLEAGSELEELRSETFIVVSFEKKTVLIGGTQYAGEMKKSIFSVLNYLLPLRGVLPMHCSANAGEKGDVALFFGLSGTGKTTLSADPERRLIGDDEHGWSEDGVFNFEGGCYAKCIGLSAEKEPQIWDAIRFGTVLENVVLNPSNCEADYDSNHYTENTRAAYPIDFIPNAVIPGVAGIPKVIFFLTADAFGVLPPISKLTKEQAMYHFLSGYTSKLAGTERGVTEPEATFSACFGAPFLPHRASVYAELLGRKIEEHKTRVYLVNTGWFGGPYGTGSRMRLSMTRAMIAAAMDGSIEEAVFSPDPVFQVLVPKELPGVPAKYLNARDAWTDKTAYDRQAAKLAQLFNDNFAKHTVSDDIRSAGPTL